ncbi:MAG: dihydroneopterin aldolase [Algoriphagus sp.]|nr:dihydroneopterin aldolase [Bacteroidota bacterium]
MGKILLEGMEFHAYHGVYSEEAIHGNRFTLDLAMELDLQEAMVSDRLDATVDYAQVYELIKSRMAIRVKLLEHLGYVIIEDIRNAFPQIKALTLTLKKHHPAIGGKVQYSSVLLSYPEDFSK